MLKRKKKKTGLRWEKKYILYFIFYIKYLCKTLVLLAASDLFLAASAESIVSVLFLQSIVEFLWHSGVTLYVTSLVLLCFNGSWICATRLISSRVAVCSTFLITVPVQRLSGGFLQTSGVYAIGQKASLRDSTIGLGHDWLESWRFWVVRGDAISFRLALFCSGIPYSASRWADVLTFSTVRLRGVSKFRTSKIAEIFP